MYEQFMQKGPDQFDISVPGPETRPVHNFMAEQNFGSFESGVGRGPVTYTDLSQMTNRSLGGLPQQASAHPVSQHQQVPPQPSMYQMGMVGVPVVGGPQFPPQQMYIPPISQHAQLMGPQTTGYVGSPGHVNMNPLYTNTSLSGGVGPPTMPPHSMSAAPMGAPNSYFPRPVGIRTGGSPANSAGSPSPGSEDSDDAGGKAKQRPSPEVPQEAAQQPAAAKGKKPRVSKKSKKKKDPNEPSKPVSAYALFFRDTQAAIKGQNPSASFGEVSKIVASMWDSLDVDSKNVYKKKTEAAKKEYLKALAAYRASFVSKGGEGDPMFPNHNAGAAYPPQYAGNAPQPYGFPPNTTNSGGQLPPHPSQGHSPPQLSPHAKKSPMLTHMMGGGPEGGANLMSPPMSQPMPPSTPTMMPPHPHGHMPAQAMGQNGPPPSMANHPNSQQQPQSGPPGGPSHMNPAHSAPSPFLNHQQANNPALRSPVSNMGGNEVGGSPGAGTNNNPLQAPGQQHLSHAPQSQGSPPNQGHPLQHPSQQAISQAGRNSCAGPPPTSGHQTGSCIRSGCSNPAVHNPEWEDEYCSNECVVSHCRDVFTNWVQCGQSGNPTYPAPVK